MAGSLLAHHIEMLRLRPDVPYENLSPSEMLKEWKHERDRIHRPVDTAHARDTDDSVLSDDLEGVE